MSIFRYDTLPEAIKWFYIFSVSGDKGKKVKEITDSPGFDSQNMQVTMQVNGIEVDAMRAISRFVESFDESAKAKAAELLAERFCSIQERIDDTFRALLLKIRREFDLPEEEE